MILYKLMFQVLDDDMSHFGDVDNNPDYCTIYSPYYYSPKKAIEDVPLYLEKYKSDILSPKFIQLIPIEIEAADEAISEEQSLREYNDYKESVQKQKLIEDSKKHRKIPFGKYKGQEVISIIKSNYQYIKWLITNTSFKLNEEETKCLNEM